MATSLGMAVFKAERLRALGDEILKLRKLMTRLMLDLSARKKRLSQVVVSRPGKQARSVFRQLASLVAQRRWIRRP